MKSDLNLRNEGPMDAWMDQTEGMTKTVLPLPCHLDEQTNVNVEATHH